MSSWTYVEQPNSTTADSTSDSDTDNAADYTTDGEVATALATAIEDGNAGAGIGLIHLSI